jgi:hypothetical protein
MNKLGTTTNTDYLESKKLCIRTHDDLEIAQVICGKGTTAPGVVVCKDNFCKDNRIDYQVCITDIDSKGWDKVYCAAKTVQSRLPEDCTNTDCLKCLSDIQDFGWQFAYNAWNNYGNSDDGNCKNLADLPLDLEGDCQRGIRIQYETSTDVWATYRAIPSTMRLCNDQLVFDATNNPELFTHNIRLYQCAVKDTCPQLCNPELGFTASFTFKAVKDSFDTVTDLVATGALVCNPAVYNTPLACVGKDVPKYCPCPASV